MKRKFRDDIVVKIKELLSKGYKTSSIIDVMELKYGIKVGSHDLNEIKKGSSYRDVASHLNDKIHEHYKHRLNNYQIENVKAIKFAISNDYDSEEIMNAYNITPCTYRNIFYLYAPYRLIAPEYNEKIQKKWLTQKVKNIDEKLVREIKELYVNSKGNINVKETAQKYSIGRVTVYMILNFKYYKSWGSKFNDEILRINNEKQENERVKQEKKQRKIKIRNKIDQLMDHRKSIETEIKNLKSEIYN